jgi:hypothetical protein
MKKLASLFVGLSLVAGIASAAGVTSVNMVGYQNLNIVSNYTFVGNNWNTVGGVSGVPIQSINGAGLVAGNYNDDSDLIIIWDVTKNAGMGGYVTYYLWNGDNKWYELGNDSAPTTNLVLAGQGFWVKHLAANTNITVSGEVPVVATNITVFGTGYTQFGSAYTVDMPLNDPKVIWTATAGNYNDDSDLVIIWDVTKNAGLGGYVTYYFWNGDNKWYELGNDSAPTTNSLPMGNGAWFLHIDASAAQLIEVKPY